MRPRIRTIKPEFFSDASVCALSRDARLTAIGLMSAADDRGRLEYSIPAIRGYVFPRDRISDRQVQKWVEAVIGAGMCAAYDAEGWPYLWLPNFWRHQLLNRPTESPLPPHPNDEYGHLPIGEALAQFREDSRNPHVMAHVVLTPSRAGARSVPVVKGVGESSTKTEKQDAHPRTVDQAALPDGLTDELQDRARACLDVLLVVHGERGGDVPTLRGVGLAVRRFPERNHVGVVHEVEHWALAGTGQRKRVKDWARTFATFLDGATNGTPLRVVANGAAVSERDARRDRRAASMELLMKKGTQA